VQKLIKNASVVMAGFVAANLLGLVRQVIINQTFGTSPELSAYFAAFRVPDFLFNVLAGGSVGSAFIPLFAGYLTEDKAKAWRLASAVLNNLLLTLCLVAGVAALLAPLLTQLLVPGFAPDLQALTAALMRVMLLSTVIFGVSGLLMGVHNAHHQFWATTLAPIIYNIGIIVGALLARQYGIQALAWGVVLGAGLHLLVQLPSLIKHNPIYTPKLDWNHPAVRLVGKLMLPRMFGLAVWQLNFWINATIASSLERGAELYAALTIAFQIFTFPQAAIAQAIATAVFPTLSAQAAQGETDALKRTLAQAMSLTLFLAMPATLGLIFLGRPIIALLFEGGEFTTESTALVTWALIWYGVGLIGHSVVEVITRAFFALKDTRTPVMIGAGAMILNVIFSLLFSRLFSSMGFLPHGGLALANSAATTIEMLGLVILLRRRIGGIDLPTMLNSSWRAAVASGVMGVGLAVWLNVIGNAPNLVIGLGGAGLGAVIYFVCAFVLRSPEIRLLLRRG
jgi:putative peptidoglycan lipid II flippase